MTINKTANQDNFGKTKIIKDTLSITKRFALRSFTSHFGQL